MKLYQRGIIAELTQKLLRNVPVLRADEGGASGEGNTNSDPQSNTSQGGAEPTQTTDPNASQSNNKPQINFEDLITRARKEEKDKLYPEIKQLKADKESLVQKNNALLISNGELKLEVENLKKQLANAGTPIESEVVKAKETEIKALQDELKELKETTVDRAVVEKEIEEKLRTEYEVKLYRTEAISNLEKSGVGVIPELVMGTTKEEIDASLEASKNRYSELFGRTVSQSLPVSSPSTNQFLAKGVSVEDLAKLDPRSMEYKELRKKLGLK